MLRHIRIGMLFLSICYLALGLLLLVLPEASLPWLCLGVSIAVLLTGIVSLVQYFRADRRNFAALCTLAGGAITTALGIYTLLRPESVRMILPIIFGLFIFVDGVVRIGAAFGFARRVPRWWVLALLGLASCLMGLALIAQDTMKLVAALEDIILFSGALLVVEGALNLGCTVYTGMVRKQLADAEAAAQTADGTAGPAAPETPEIPATPAPTPEPVPAPEPAPDPVPPTPTEEMPDHEV